MIPSLLAIRAQIAALIQGSTTADEDLARDLADQIMALRSPEGAPPAPHTDPALVELARDVWAVDGEIEIDDGATVSLSEDSDGPRGAYVAAWVWIDAPVCEADGCDQRSWETPCGAHGATGGCSRCGRAGLTFQTSDKVPLCAECSDGVAL